jgi:hypothetical protein
VVAPASPSCFEAAEMTLVSGANACLPRSIMRRRLGLPASATKGLPAA